MSIRDLINLCIENRVNLQIDVNGIAEYKDILITLRSEDMVKVGIRITHAVIKDIKPDNCEKFLEYELNKLLYNIKESKPKVPKDRIG